MAIGKVITMAGSPGTDISDANAGVGDVLASKTFYATSGGKKTGTMTDRGTVSTDIITKAQEVTIAAGKHSGEGIVKISAAEQAKIIAENIKDGVTILGQAGSLSAGGGGSIIVRAYTSGATWTKPAGLLYLFVQALGGGGGGGSGRKYDSGAQSAGGAGGGTAPLCSRLLLASQVGSTVGVTVGSGGGGGASVTSSNTNGNAGADGGDSSFGTLVLSKGGGGGWGGTTTGVNGQQGAAYQSYPKKVA